jgi:hypothetical protein
MTTRTDPHRPGAIIPTDYVFVLWYAIAMEVDGWPQPPRNVDIVAAMLHDPAIKWAETGGLGHCSVCGAYYKYGEVWRHEPTGEHIHVGHDCADKYNMLTSRAEWESWHKEQHDLRAAAIQKRARVTARDAFFADRPGLAETLAVTHPILQDMARKLYLYGSLSEKQLAFAAKLATEATAPKPPEESHVPAPEGRVTVRGAVVAIKTQDSAWGTQVKMLVKVDTDGGSWLCWSTVPDSVLGVDEGLRGATIEFSATLTRSDRDSHFAFAKRPTKARLTGSAEAL